MAMADYFNQWLRRSTLSRQRAVRQEQKRSRELMIRGEEWYSTIYIDKEVILLSAVEKVLLLGLIGC